MACRAGERRRLWPADVSGNLSIASQLDISLEEASSLLGANRWSTFRRITYRCWRTGILAGMFLVFIQSIENVSLALFLAPAGQQVLPLEMFAMLTDTLKPASPPFQAC